MSDLGREFLLAIGAVILVTIVLLPLRVAVIAAVAIPVTVCTSLGVLNAIGIQLHQVSIAALIVVLGIVVDDAIVIADNYVDCLDRGIPRSEAAWQCVREVLVPVITATLTIIASFLPLLIICTARRASSFKLCRSRWPWRFRCPSSSPCCSPRCCAGSSSARGCTTAGDPNRKPPCWTGCRRSTTEPSYSSCTASC